MPQLERDGDVFVLNFGDTENRFHPDWLAAVEAALDEIEKADGPRALVTTGTGKFYSNGLDLEWIAAHFDDIPEHLGRVHGLFARVLAFPVPTIAALQGHTFAAGAMIALAQDFRVMRADRGFFCLPEVDIQIPFTPGMSALIQSRLTKQVAHEAMTTARRYGGVDAQSAGIVDQIADEGKVLEAAVELARPLAGKAGATLGAIKTQMYAQTLAVLREKNVEFSALGGS